MRGGEGGGHEFGLRLKEGKDKGKTVMKGPGEKSTFKSEQGKAEIENLWEKKKA